MQSWCEKMALLDRSPLSTHTMPIRPYIVLQCLSGERSELFISTELKGLEGGENGDKSGGKVNGISSVF